MVEVISPLVDYGYQLVDENSNSTSSSQPHDLTHKQQQNPRGFTHVV